MATEPPRRRGRPPGGGRDAILAAALQLLRERGIARLTTRDVATVAGVSEASIYYHYTDRAGLLKAVFEEGLHPLQQLAERGEISGPNRRAVLGTLGPVIERFLDQALPVMSAAQSDTELRDALAEYMTGEDLGPHRGVQALGDYFASEQEAGRARADIDPHAAALMFVGSCYIRSAQRQMPGHEVTLPELDDVIEALDAMLAPKPG